MNWAGNLSYSATEIKTPNTVEELQELVAVTPKVKALGTRHSFSDIADTTGDLISTQFLDQLLSIDLKGNLVTIQGGVTYGDLCEFLDEHGFSIHNLASLPHISVAGACSTATHGSGELNGCLSTAVESLKLVRADGEIESFSREEGGDFAGAVVSLGSLGIITELSLQIAPSFQMSQEVFQNVPLRAALDHFDEIQAMAYSVSFFTHWRDGKIDQIWLKHKGSGSGEPELFSGKAATTHLHPLTTMSPVNCSPQMGELGPWHERMPHFRMDYTPSSGEELQSEYLVLRRHAIPALEEIAKLGPQISDYLHVSEIRTIAADDLWMSPFYQEPGVGIHFTWKKDWPSVRQLLPLIEEKLAPFDAKPHWGKLFAMGLDQIEGLYPRLGDFRALMARLDPQGKFRNSFNESKLG